MTAEADAEPDGKPARREDGLAHSLTSLSTFVAIAAAFAFLYSGFSRSLLIAAIWVLFPASRFLATALHELGHVIGALAAGWRPVVVAAWPFAYHLPSNTIVVNAHVSVNDGGGYVYAAPRRPEFNTRLRLCIFAAGGPVLSLLVGALVLACVFLPMETPILAPYAAGVAAPVFVHDAPSSDLSRQLAAVAAAIGALSLNAFFTTIIPMTYRDGKTSDGKMLFDVLVRADPNPLSAALQVAGLLHYNVRLRDIPQWMYDAARADTYQPYPSVYDGWDLARSFDERNVDPIRCRRLLEDHRARHGEDDWLASLDAYLSAVYEGDADRGAAALAARPAKANQPPMWHASEAAIAARRGDLKLMHRKLDEMESGLLAESPFPNRTFQDIRRQIETAGGIATAD